MFVVMSFSATGAKPDRFVGFAYAEIRAKKTGKPVEPAKLIAPTPEKFIGSDRGFRRARGEHREFNS